jgi:hypothetical protein
MVRENVEKSWGLSKAAGLIILALANKTDEEIYQGLATGFCCLSRSTTCDAIRI